jgi:hypothetical protein
MPFSRFGGSPPYAPVAVGSPFSFPAVNEHTLIVGSSGSGKSYLVSRIAPSDARIVLFKPDPLFSGVPLASDSGLPSPFSFYPYDVADAYLYALGLDFSGIMASSLVPVLMSSLSAVRAEVETKRETGKDVHPMDSFFRILHKETEKVSSAVSRMIISHFGVLYPEYKAKRGRPSKDKLASFASVSFAGLGRFRSEFGAELYLRGMYSFIGSSFGALVIDEFHHVARSGSVVDQLLREFRVSGRLIALTQSLSDVSPSMLANFGYVLLGRSIHPQDISYLASLSSALPRIVSGLPPRVFLSLGEYLVRSDPLPLYGWID